MELNGAFYCSRCMRKMEDDGVCPHCGLDNDRAENSAPALELYTLLDNRYQLGSVIGSGGSGITYAAWDEKLWIPVAVKEYYPAEWVTRDCSVTDEITVRQEFQRDYLIGKERFLRESRVLAMLQEIPGIVKVYDSFEENQTAYIVMEYVHGVTIDKYMREQGLQQGKILQMMRQPIDALAAVHKQGVLHRDITPNNMLVQEDGSVKLIDFGAAAQIGQQGDIVVLTQHYAAIEQYDRDNGRLGPWTDVYGISATLYALLTGEEPQESVTRLQRDHLKDLDKQKNTNAQISTEGNSQWVGGTAGQTHTEYGRVSLGTVQSANAGGSAAAQEIYASRGGSRCSSGSADAGGPDQFYQRVSHGRQSDVLSAEGWSSYRFGAEPAGGAGDSRKTDGSARLGSGGKCFSGGLCPAGIDDPGQCPADWEHGI